MSNFNAKGALLIAGAVMALFGGIEIYGISVVGDWSILRSTIVCQLVAITLAVAPMMYGLVFAAHEEGE
jgi:hypothetical protein